MKKIRYFFIALFLLGQAYSQDSLNAKLLEAAYNGNETNLIQALKSGANINCVSYNSLSPLMYASLQGHHNLVKILLHNGANINQQGDKGYTALHLAVDADQFTITKLLLNAGANPNISDSSGNTPLLLCAKFNSLDQAAWLLDYGADPHQKNADGFNFIDLLIKHNCLGMIEYFEQKQLFSNDLNNLDYTNIALHQNNQYLFQKLLNYGFTKNSKPVFYSLVHKSMASVSVNDFYITESVGVFESKYKVLSTLDFGFRFNPAVVKIKQGQNSYYQLFEKRFLIGLNFSKYFYLSNTYGRAYGFLTGLGGALNTISYEGLPNESKELKIIPDFDLGLFYQWRYIEAQFSVTYNNFDMPDYSPVFLSFGFLQHLPLPYKQKTL